MEQQLVATIGTFLPASKLIVDCKANSFLEAFSCPCGEPDDIAVTLETKRNVEIFRHLGFGLELLIAVFVRVTDLLDSTPSEDSIVTNEWSYVSIGNCVFDSRVNHIRKERDAGLKERIDDLHDTVRELHDTDVGRLFHFQGCIEETIDRNSGCRCQSAGYSRQHGCSLEPRLEESHPGYL